MLATHLQEVNRLLHLQLPVQCFTIAAQSNNSWYIYCRIQLHNVAAFVKQLLLVNVLLGFLIELAIWSDVYYPSACTVLNFCNQAM